MDFIENIFGISPDHGSGLTEVAIVVALCAAAWLYFSLRQRRRQTHYTRDETE